MPFNFCPKRDASFWENGSELKRFVLELQTGGFADYTEANGKRKHKKEASLHREASFLYRK